MSNKRILRHDVDGVELSVSVFDKSDASEAGEVSFCLEVHQAGIHFYCRPAELSKIGYALVEAANVAAAVEETGELPK